jgi:hypothetical protein
MTLIESSQVFKKAPKTSAKRISLRHQYARFGRQLLVATAVPMAAIAAVNSTVDPYGFWRLIEQPGINAVRPRQDNNDRLYKAADIVRQKPDVVILGSSRTKQAIDPDHEGLQAYSPQVYNLAINGPNAYEVRRYFDHALANQAQPELVVLGIDFFMFNADLGNQPSFNERRLGISHLSLQDAATTTLSLDTLQASWETIQANRPPSEVDGAYEPNGFGPNREAEDGKRQWRFNQSAALYFELHSDYKLSEEYLAEFQRIVELCEERDIPLVIFISPAHATQWEAIRATGHWETFEAWKRRIVAIAPVWDFSGYNTVTTEPMGDEMDYYTDNSHYSVPVGNWVLDRILSPSAQGVPEDFGVWVTPDNLETHLQTIREDRQTWARQNQDEVDWVKDIQGKQQAQTAQ